MHRSLSILIPVALAAGCKKPEPPPLDMILQDDGVIYAGAAQIDVTPVIRETWTDGNGNNNFDGCFDDPTGVSCDAPDTWDDADGDGTFDAVWIAGFGTLRPANAVHDPITVSATVLSYDGEYIALVAMDWVGIHSPRIHQARDALAADGFDPDHLLAASSHNHQGPDVFGIWGDPTNFAAPVSGLDPEYQQLAAEAIEAAVRDAAANMEPVELRVGAVRMRDRGAYFNGEKFGGLNPTAKMHGMIHDIRDPVLVSDQVLVLQGATDDGAVFTLTNWSGHPETWGGNNLNISADWVGKTREVLADTYGGVAMHMPESLGGMQSALGGDLPRVDEQSGEIVLTDETFEDGTPVPEWAERNTWDFVQSHGWHIAHAAIDALEQGDVLTEAPIRVEAQDIHVPVTNSLYALLLPLDLTELRAEDASFDATDCPDAAITNVGCFPVRTFRAQIGEVGFAAVPGELLPEIAWGLPDDDPVWIAESTDPTLRGPDSTYFPQHDNDCDTLDYDECLEELEIGDCACNRVHRWPYAYAIDPDMPPLLDLLDTDYRAVLGMTDHYLSYIIPENDYNRAVSYLAGDLGDHYEDSVSASYRLGTRVQEGQLAIDERWESAAE